MRLGIQTFRLCRSHPSVFKRIWQNILADDCLDMAAEMSFYFVLSLFPFFLVLAAILGWLPSTTVWQSFAQWITDYLPHQSRRVVFSTILDLTRGYSGFLSFGLVAALWSASSGFVSLMESLTVAYGARDVRGYWKKRAIATCATIVAALFFLASFGLLAMGHWGASQISFRLSGISAFQIHRGIGRWIATLAMMVLAIDAINYFLPGIKRRWHWLTSGTAFVVITLIASTWGLNFYVRRFGTFPRIYGALAGFFILLTWIYIVNLIVLIGAEADQEMELLSQQGAGV